MKTWEKGIGRLQQTQDRKHKWSSPQQKGVGGEQSGVGVGYGKHGKKGESKKDDFQRWWDAVKT